MRGVPIILRGAAGVRDGVRGIGDMVGGQGRRAVWLGAWAVGAVLACAGCGPKEVQTASAYGEPEKAFTAPPPAPGAPLAVSAAPTDAAAALARMTAAYRQMSSLYVSTVAEVAVNLGQGERKSHQETVLEYVRQPARIALYVRDTEAGTQALLADGATLVRWVGVTNRYRRTAASGSLPDLCAAVDKEAIQLMSPLVFAASPGPPPGVESPQVTGTETVDGKTAQVVQGSLSAAFMATYAERIFGARMARSKARFTLWLDAGTGIVLKSATDLAWTGVAKDQDGRVVARDPSISATERTVRFVPNPALPDDRFRFLPPRGAQEAPVERVSDVK